MNEVERYLSRATRGLWGRKREEVREELEAHIQERVMAYRIAGLGEQDATERTLQEFGHPREVSAGMARIYALPTLFEMSLLAVAACVLVVTLSSSSLAQSVTGSFYFPSEACVQEIETGTVSLSPSDYYQSGMLAGDCIIADNSLWLSIESLEQTLEPQGVEVNYDGFLTLDFPGANRIFVASGANDIRVMREDGTEVSGQPSYVSLWRLLRAASELRSLNISVAGWDNPTVNINEASLQIGTEQQPMKGRDFYDNYLNAVLFGDVINPVIGASYVDVVNPYLEKALNTANFEENAPLRTLQVDSTQGNADGSSDVYGVMVVLDVSGPLTHRVENGEPGDVPNIGFLMDVARVNQEGQIDVHLPTGKVQFVETLSTNPEPGTAVLVRLTGGTNEFQKWYEIVSSEQIQEVN